MRLPVKPVPALTPRPVPFVDQALLVAPAGSIRSCGLVVVALPPVNQAPLTSTDGVDAAPAVELVCAADHVFAAFNSGIVAPLVPVFCVDAVPRPVMSVLASCATVMAPPTDVCLSTNDAPPVAVKSRLRPP